MVAGAARPGLQGFVAECTFPSQPNRSPGARCSPRATAAEWGDWRWQMRNAVRSLEALEALRSAHRRRARGGAGDRLHLPAGDQPLLPVAHRPAITRSARCGCRPSRCRPRRASARASCWIRSGEDKTRPVSAIVHKYPDRVLFLALDTCSVYCRHCTRRRITKGGEAELDKEELRKGIEYVRAHPEVRDVLISGGDPFLLSDAAAGGAAGAAQGDPARGDDPDRHPRPGVPADAGNGVARADAARARARLRGDALQPPQGDHPRGARAPASCWWITACRWRTRRC